MDRHAQDQSGDALSMIDTPGYNTSKTAQIYGSLMGTLRQSENGGGIVTEEEDDNV